MTFKKFPVCTERETETSLDQKLQNFFHCVHMRHNFFHVVKQQQLFEYVKNSLKPSKDTQSILYNALHVMKYWIT